jgi:hypothetical protein
MNQWLYLTARPIESLADSISLLGGHEDDVGELPGLATIDHLDMQLLRERDRIGSAFYDVQDE